MLSINVNVQLVVCTHYVPKPLSVSTVYYNIHLHTNTSMLTHQVAVGVVAVFFRHGQVNSQGHTVGKDG